MADRPSFHPCPNHGTHSFNFEELKTGTGSNRQPYFRAMIFFTKKPHHTDEFFHEHWKTVHADLCLSVQNTSVTLVRYVQFHQDKAHRQAISSIIGSGHFLPTPYDGCAEFHCESAEHFLKFLDDLNADKKLVGCGSRFVNADFGMHIMVGYDNLIYGDASVISGGKNGIMPDDNRLRVSSSATTASNTISIDDQVKNAETQIKNRAEEQTGNQISVLANA